MSSYLEKQANAFKGTLASVSTRVANPKAAAAAAAAAGKASSLAPPSPSPSAVSEANTPSSKRKRDVPGVPYSQPQLTGYGTDLMTNMTFAVEYLKKKREEAWDNSEEKKTKKNKGEEKTIVDIVGHLSLKGGDEQRKTLAEGLRRHPRINWKPDASLSEQTWHSGVYTYRPIIPNVHSPGTLKHYLKSRPDASGVSVKDLKDGWPHCDNTIREMEVRHEILVSRTNRDNAARFIWDDDPDLWTEIDKEFKQRWVAMKNRIPKDVDMHQKLEDIGQKPSSEDPRLKIVDGGKPKVKKRKAGTRPSKMTNQHLGSLLQDFSAKRR